MKTVSRNVHVVSQDQAVDVSGLPQEVSLALADIASVAREGLLAMSVAAGMAVMQAMFEAEITAVAGPKGKHDPGREVVRHGTATQPISTGFELVKFQEASNTGSLRIPSRLVHQTRPIR